jgi:hypothetical protein
VIAAGVVRQQQAVARQVLRVAQSGRMAKLSPAARAFRAVHALIALGFLGAIGYVWFCVLTGHRDRRLRLASAALVAEGAVVAANHGDCPLGPLQDRLHDPTPLFELVLSPTAAKRTIPVLGAVAGLGIALAQRAPRSANSGARVRAASAA